MSIQKLLDYGLYGKVTKFWQDGKDAEWITNALNSTNVTAGGFSESMVKEAIEEFKKNGGKRK